MIITLLPEKDSYVTNIKTIKNDGAYANVGHAATLDLFKLYNENKHSKSWAAFKFTAALTVGNKLTLTDVDGNRVIFILDNSIIEDGSTNGSDEVLIGINDISTHSDSDPKNYSQRFATVINNVTSFNNGLTLNMTAYGNSNNELVLKQNKPGASGDTSFTLPVNGGMAHVGGAGVAKFARIDYSAALLKFNLSDFKQNWITLIDDDDVDSDIDDLTGAFDGLKAELVLKDVTTGITKPKDYKLKVYSLKKDFNEGIGKDTIHFSDKDTTNFINFNKTDLWAIPEFISKNIDTSSASINNTTIGAGDEDIKLDVSTYIISQLESTAAPTDKGFLVTFDDAYLYNSLSYFVKRAGSRHLLNKRLVPELNIKIDDSSHSIPKSTFKKKRYLNSAEDFYLFNRTSGSLATFEKPNTRCNLKVRITSKDKLTVYVEDNESSDSSNFRGQTLEGVKKSSIAKESLNRYNSQIADNILNSKLNTKVIWYWLDDADAAKLISAGSFVIGKRYKINTSTNTNFVAIGAVSNDEGIVFTATGVGAGDNNAYELIEYIVHEESVDFLTSETIKENAYINMTTSIHFENDVVKANNEAYPVAVYFTDTRSKLDYVKVPQMLASENLGDVFYQVYDVDTGNILIDFHNTADLNYATKLFYDGEKYTFNIYIPETFKNKNIGFNFKTTDHYTNNNKTLSNQNIKVKVQ
jgi:hypothetical protein